tara:strand:- start:83 stop:202 length:120 start_codon:yes stop_codon:yes gene_type:complete
MLDLVVLVEVELVQQDLPLTYHLPHQGKLALVVAVVELT